MRRTLYGLAAAAAGLAVIALFSAREPTPRSPAGPAPAPGAPAGAALQADRLAPGPARSSLAATLLGEPALQGALTEYPVDLHQLRAMLPDNLYWETSVPTSDPAVARRRADRARRLNELYGKILSGTGTDEEIRTYFAERRREHEDAIGFATAALETAGARLPERDRSLLQFAIELHTARLDEAPARMEEAFARKAEQDRRREAWRAAGSPVP